MISRRVLFASTVAALVASACSKPEPPRLVPKEAKVVGVGLNGLSLVLALEATNPNRITLSAQSVTARAKLDGKWDVNAITISKPVVLPPNIPTRIDVPMTLPWTDVTALGTLATATGPVPYVVEGNVTVGGETLNVTLPFTLSGTITREQLVSAALKSLPAIPGLTYPVQP